MTALAKAIWWILYESSLYLLVGFALAGVFNMLFAHWRGLAERLKRGRIRSVLWATLIGAPLDLCSCSVLPVAMTLRRRGARPGAVYSFVISVPEVDMVSILQTNALLGPVMAVVRPVTALVTALVTGVLANFLEPWLEKGGGGSGGAAGAEAGPEGAGKASDSCAEESCGCAGEAASISDSCGHEHGPSSQVGNLCHTQVGNLCHTSQGGDSCHSHRLESGATGGGAGLTEGGGSARTDVRGSMPAEVGSSVAWVRRAARFGFVEFFDDLIGSLLLGVVLGGLIGVLLPKIGLDRFAGGSFIALVAMLLLAIPMYVCATASTPMAVGMIVGGVSPGAALVFLLAGPATNAAGILVLAREMGRRGVLLYLACIFAISLLAGAALDAALARGWATMPALTLVVTTESVSPIKVGGAVLMMALTLASLRRTHLVRRMAAGLAARTGLPLTGPRLALCMALVAAMAYVGSGFFSVPPGSRGMVLKFGRVSASDLPPGLHFNWPYPLGGRRIVAVDRVRRVELGFRSTQEEMVLVDPSRDPYRDESWMLTGNEDIIDIRWTVQYRPREGAAALQRYAFGVEAVGELVRAAAEAAIREVVAVRGIDRLLTEDRAEVERRIAEDVLGPMLDRWDAGVQIVDVQLVDVHAPAPVHPAFRDVASASEQKMGKINEALDTEGITISRANAGATERVETAKGRAAQIVGRAAGDTALFAAQREAFAKHPSATRLEAYLARMEAVLPRLKKYVSLVGKGDAQIDLWMGAAPKGAPAPVPPSEKD
ncbi:MAG: permease [Phycisphaerales bacterium]|nr:permease [Phycisphaerales bacterium]